MTNTRFSVEGVRASWQVLLRDGDSMRRLPIVGEELRTGKGPEGLEWQATEDAGVPGIRALWHSGSFLIMRVTKSRYALFHERRPGDWTALALGGPDALKVYAAERMKATPVPGFRRPTVDCNNSTMRAIYSLRFGR